MKAAKAVFKKDVLTAELTLHLAGACSHVNTPPHNPSSAAHECGQEV